MKEYLPTLLKTDSKGITQEWKVWYRPKLDGTAELGTEYGHQGGKMQEHSVIIREGKNLGRKNETTPLTQAAAEAQSQWNEKVRKGYSATGEQQADRGVMLAVDYHDLRKRKIGVNLPDVVMVDPKLDGIRAKWHSGSFLSRGHKAFKAIPQRIHQYLQGRGPVDGEMYIHGVSLRTLNGLVNKPNAILTPRLEYHLFDLPIPGMPVEERKARLKEMYDNDEAKAHGIFVVPYYVIDSVRVREYMDRFIAAGYEGIMIRLLKSMYLFNNKRSYDLIKWKDFLEMEFEVIDIIPDREGYALAVCRYEGVEFEVTLKATDWMKDDIMKNPDKLIGKPLTTRFQGWLDSGKPQFARGIVERIYE